MNIRAMLISVVAVAMAGCCSFQKCCYDRNDPVIGNWGLKLPFDDMSAGSMIVERDAHGNVSAVVLWRWASPIRVKNFVVNADKFSFDHPWGFKVRGAVNGDRLEAELINKNAKNGGQVIGWRNPPICDKISTKDAKFGEKIDLLKDGLAGWESMNPNARFAWEFKDGVLSNKLRGKHGGANIKTKRVDFYDFKLEYDVRVPKNSNSGVYLRGRYEIQTVDSYGKKVDCHNMAAYYGRVTPSVAAEKPAGEWQHVSVVLYKRHLTVVLNGTTIIDNVPVVGVTGGAIDANEFMAGPIYLQGDHSDADYRNMYLYPAVD